MKTSKNTRNFLLWTIVLSIIFPMLMPVFVYADNSTSKLIVNNTEYSLSLEPYENDMGLMVAAEDISKAFSFEYAFDAENKVFTIEDGVHGKVILMHNATQFYSGERTYSCAPYFYVENSVPMIETGFFCNMFGASYSYDKETKCISIVKDKLSDNIARVNVNDEITPLYITPFKNELGLITGIEDLARAFGVKYTYNETNETAVLSDDMHGDVILKNGAESFTSNAGEFKCSPFFFTENNVPLIEVGFFCELYGAGYKYDDVLKTIYIEKGAFSEQTGAIIRDDTDASLMDTNAILSGTVTYSKGAPSNGLNVDLILQQTCTRYVNYVGYRNYVGETYILGTVNLSSGETSKNYSFDVSQYYSENYPTYTLFYAEDNIKEYGYYNTGNSTTPLDSSPMYSETYYTFSKQFSANASDSANITIGNKNSVSGKITIENDIPAPESGIDINLILKTRTSTKTNVYGTVYYTIGDTYNLGTVNFAKGEKEKNYSYIVSTYFKYDYPYYTLFYESDDINYVKPYGYYNNKNEITSIDTSPLTSNAIYTSSRAFNTTSDSSADMVIPLSDSYNVPVTGITLSKNSLSLPLNESETISAAVLPDGASNKAVTWKNLNPDIVTFDSSTGTIIALAVGTAKITATTVDGSYTAECTVSVYDKADMVTSVTLDKSNINIDIGKTAVLKASVLPETVSNKSIKWTTANDKIATVSNSGVVTGVSEGTTQIYATSENNSACYAICNVTVSKPYIAVTGIELDKNVFSDAFEVDIGKNLVFSPTIKPSNATNQNVLWTSSDNSVATVNDGIVTGVSEGTVSVTATTVDGGFSASVTVKVKKPTVYVKGIVTNTDQLTVNVMESKRLQASVVPTDATDKTITFESNNNAIATVSDTGLVTGVSQGTTLIKAISNTSAGKFVAFCTVTVPKPVVDATSIKLDKGSISIVEGKTVPLKVVIKPVNATYKMVTWSVGDESVATVTQDGYITAVGVGETVVSATTVNNKTTSCTVTVLPSDTPAQLTVEDAQVKSGKDIPITVSIASNPGISTFTFDLTYNHEKLYPVSYKNGDVLKNVTVITPLGSQSFESKDSVRFLCQTNDSKNMDTDGELITVVFRTKTDIELGTETIGIVPSGFINENGDAINLQQDDCSLEITDYTIGDVNNDDSVDLKDSMILAQYIAGFDVELSEQGKKAAVRIYPDGDTDTPEPSLNDFQHLFRHLSDWQVELGKK